MSVRKFINNDHPGGGIELNTLRTFVAIVEALRVLDKCLPVRIQMDNGSLNGRTSRVSPLDLFRPGKPTDNAFI